MLRPIEYRSFPGWTEKAEANGILKAYVSVMGIPDQSWWNDIVEPGAFSKTIAECGPKGNCRIRVLNQHSVREVIGKPIEMAEHSRDQLPAEMRQRYPNATGGLYVVVSLEMRVERVRDVYYLYEGGSMNEWSIGFQTINSWTEVIEKEEYRHLTEVKLWECSPVTWGAQEATTTIKGDLAIMVAECQRLHPQLSDNDILAMVQKRLDPKKIAEPVPVAPLTTNADEVALLRQRLDLHTQRLRGYV